MELEAMYCQFAAGERGQPHRLLGLHKEGKLIRLWRPQQEEAAIWLRGEKRALERVHPSGIFQLELSAPVTAADYVVTHPTGLMACDPYAFLPTFTRRDEQLWNRGCHWNIYRALGGHWVRHQGVEGVKFAVWAPCAVGVVLMAHFNDWSPKLHPMRQMGSSGVWELFVPGLSLGERYQFGIYTREKEFLQKADPYAFQGEMRPQTRSVICAIDRYTWRDEQWLEQRKAQQFCSLPLNIYEIHLGSWKRERNQFKTYRELAPQLIDYCHHMGYTHIELMPIMGHPLDESWGYQVSGYYAISRRYGTVEDFQFFVDALHRSQIGVILDWVPGHFPIDDHALARFDGTCLYEHLDPKQGFHPQWTTHIFNFGRYEVANFLIGSALFYLREMHIDGFRIDAVSSMVYLNFERKQGEWIPNEKGGNENLAAIAFLRQLTSRVKAEFPDVLLIAEESHAFPGVTAAVDRGGLGFDGKWSLGWMNDTLRFFARPLDKRERHLSDLVHEMSYFFDERFVLPLSHDEVVHGKKSLLSKMPGNEWQKFANVRLLISYMICHPGKKLLFMGNDLGQWHEWASNEEVHWELLNVPYHQKLHRCLRALYQIYRTTEALFSRDFERSGFEWVDKGENKPVLAYFRRGNRQTLLCIHHFGVQARIQETFSFKESCHVRQIFTTDSLEYGGYGMIDKKPSVSEKTLTITLPPLATLIIEVV